MALVDVGAEPESKLFSLSEVQEWVRGIEALLGPIVKIGNDGNQTAGTFDANNPQNPPSATEAIVKLSPDGSAPAGKTKLCDGWVFVSNSIQRVVVYR